MPHSIRVEIESQFPTDRERKARLLSVYKEEHPNPTWEYVSVVLYQCSGGDKECHRALDILQSKFPTGVSHAFPSFLSLWHTYSSHSTYTNNVHCFCCGMHTALYSIIVTPYMYVAGLFIRVAFSGSRA